MAKRRRVGLVESFRIANRASAGVDDPGQGDASFFAVIAFGLWWWIAGVPDSAIADPEQRPEEGA